MKLKDLSVFREKHLYEVCLVGIKEQVVEKRDTVGTHVNADGLLKHIDN